MRKKWTLPDTLGHQTRVRTRSQTLADSRDVSLESKIVILKENFDKMLEKFISANKHAHSTLPPSSDSEPEAAVESEISDQQYELKTTLSVLKGLRKDKDEVSPGLEKHINDLEVGLKLCKTRKFIGLLERIDQGTIKNSDDVEESFSLVIGEFGTSISVGDLQGIAENARIMGNSISKRITRITHRSQLGKNPASFFAPAEASPDEQISSVTVASSAPSNT